MNGLAVDRKIFWKLYHEKFDEHGVVTPGTVEGLNYLLDRFEQETRLDNIPQFSYVLATAFHESGKIVVWRDKKVLQRFQPVREGKASQGSEIWIKYQSKYWHTGFFGRGLAQTTHEINYLKIGRLVGVGDLFVRQPDLLLENEWAYEALVAAMVFGLYRADRHGRCDLDRYFPPHLTAATLQQFDDARDIINGDQNIHRKGYKHPMGREIAIIAFAFQEILIASQTAKANRLARVHSDNSFVVAGSSQQSETSEFTSSANASPPVNPASSGSAIDRSALAAIEPQNGQPQIVPNSPPNMEVKPTNFNPSESPSDSPSQPEVKLNLEDWKPWAFGWLKKIWAGFTGVQVTQTTGNAVALLKSGEYWYIPLLVIVALFVISFIVCALLSLAVIAIWQISRREINRAKELEAKSKLDPNSPNLGLTIEKIETAVPKLLNKIKGFAPAPV